MKHARRGRSPLPTIAAVAAVLLVAVLVGGMYLWEQRAAASQPAPDTSRGKTVEEMLGLADGGEAPVYFDGKWYQHAKGIESYLFMGVDRRGVAQSSGSYNDGGQADVLMLLVIDHENKRFRVLQLNRDTMTDVYVLAMDLSVLGVEYEQLALAHFYGDGMESSCENTVRTVSNLLYGVPIDGYAALQMDSIPILNDMVGGVTVTIEDDLTPADPTLVQGETVTLMGDHAMNYVHARMAVGDGTNLARMRRHRTYLQGFEEQLKASIAANQSFILDMYDALQEYLVTDISTSTLTYIAQQCMGYENGGIITMKGEAREGAYDFMEFYPDEDDLRGTILDLFYEETEQAPAEQGAGSEPSAD